MGDAATVLRDWTVRVRKMRAVLAAVLAVEVAVGALSITRGVFPFWPLVAAIVLVYAIRRQTRAIRQAQAVMARPDYLLIAAMELDVYGRTFDHAGSTLPFG